MTLMYIPWMVASGESLGVEATEVNFIFFFFLLVFF